MKYINSMAIVLGLVVLLGALQGCSSMGSAGSRERVVMQISDNDPAKWNLALNNAKNVQQMIGADKAEVEIVVYGPGINMLKMDSAVAGRVDEAKNANVKIVACENTMKSLKLSKEDMLPNTNYVPAGVVELMKKQKEGYAYIRP